MAGRKKRLPGRVFCLPAMLAALLALAAQGSLAWKMPPYLQAVTTNSVYVLVESDTRDPLTVEYGTTTNYGSKITTETTGATTASPPTFVHRLKLTGLASNTVYNYRVVQGAAASANYSFVTVAEPDTSFRFAWMADCRTQPAIHDQIAGKIRDFRPRFSLYGGDLCERPDYSYWKSEFFVPNQLALAATVPFFNAVGNHESWDKGANTRVFTLAPESASGTQDYYSFDYGDAHFLCLNTEIPYGPDSPQYKFAAQDLVSTKKTWKIVYFHKPAYSLGGNGDDAGMKLMTTYIFEPGRVDLILNGHNHFYQHNLVNGIHHFTIGTAGAPIASPGTGSYVVKAAFAYNFAIVDVTPTKLDLTAYDDNGTAIDRLSLTKSGPPDPAATPIVLPTPPPPLPPIVVSTIARKSAWKYYATGKAPDAAWKEKTFVDRDWPSGNGPLGFGESYIMTALPSGHQTYYLRKTFSFSGGPSNFRKLTLFVNYDDGFILYLDGKELARRGLPPGAVGPGTPAAAHEGGTYEAIDLGHLIPTLTKGVYVLAVELHQNEAKGGDLVWDAELVYELPAA